MPRNTTTPRNSTTPGKITTPRNQPAVLAFCFLLCGLSACHLGEQFSTPLWIYHPTKLGLSRWDTVLNAATFLDLEPDGRFTRDFDRFEYGKWSLLGDRLFLTDQHNLTYVYLVPLNNKKELRIRISAQKIAHFESLPRPSADSTKNPFSLFNNYWRLPATQSETVAEIRQRLLNHLHFWEAYFQWYDDNSVGEIDVTDIPTPLKIHGNGFGLLRYNYLPAKWKSYFFSENDCHTADSLIRGVFKRTDIKWPDSGDDGQKFISGIQQLETALR
jgi:hypothetical protein